MYLLVSVAACDHAERCRFARSAAFGFLGGLVRPNGVLLSIPILGLFCFSAYLGRFSSVLFPVFAWLATRVRGRARTRLILAFAAGQAVLAALFFISKPIF